MRLDLSTAPEGAIGSPGVQPGDVYRKDGGPGGVWVVVSTSDNGYCYVLGVDHDGNVVTSSRYGTYYFERKAKVGEIKAFQEKWEISWL